MSKAEKYLPFILAAFTPLVSAFNNSNLHSDQHWQAELVKYVEASSFLLLIWFANKWLLYTDFKAKRVLGTEVSAIIMNLLLLSSVAALDYFVIPNGLSSILNFWVLLIRFSLAALIFNVILRVFKFQTDRASLKLQNVELQAENLKFQMEVFKQQINPHFLFNSLNTLLDLIEDDQEAAAQYVRNFSDLYRVVLHSIQRDFVTLEDELKFMEDYWSLLKVRFKEAIALDLHISEDKKQYLVPPLSLQFLIENAVKHNEATQKTPLVITIIEAEGLLVVKNKIHLKSYPVEGEKIGLKNLQQRFTLLHQPIKYGSENSYFNVQLPLKRP